MSKGCKYADDGGKFVEYLFIIGHHIGIIASHSSDFDLSVINVK